MTNSPTSPTAAVLRALLAPNEGPECNTIVYSYRDQFEDLWHAEPGKDPVAWACGSSNAGAGDGQRATSKERTLVLVWDGMPDSSTAGAPPAQWQSANIRDRVTAYDWLVAFLLRLQQAIENTEQHANLRVLVLDLASSNYPGSLACFAFPALAARLSGVRVYAPGEAEGLLADLGVPAAAATPWKRLDPADVGSNAFKRGIEWLRRLWLDELTRAETRHDVANMLAPLLMAEELVDVEWPGAEALHDKLAGSDNHRRALAALVRTLGGLSPTMEPAPDPDNQAAAGHPVQAAPPAKPTAGPLQQAFVQDDVFGRFSGGVRFLMVDDQADGGYHEIVASVLFGSDSTYHKDSHTHSAGSGGHVLRWESTPDTLVDALWNSVNLTRSEIGASCGNCGGRGAHAKELLDWESPRLLASTAIGGPDVLLLDLRLFSGSESNAESERKHMRALLDFCHQSGLCRQLHESRKHFTQLPVKRALRRAIEGAKQRLADLPRAKDAPARLDHLALLPLLLTLVDPSLPIVLFSSTRQRSILAALEERPNIISSFAKPILSGYAEGQSLSDRTTNVADLIEAISQALDLHERRAVWIQLSSVNDGMPPQTIQDIGKQDLYEGSVRRSALRYTVSPQSVEDLAREFISTVYTGRYADALQVPSNWLESIGAQAEEPIFVPLLPLFGGGRLLMPDQRAQDLRKGAGTNPMPAADLSAGIVPHVRCAVYKLLDLLRHLRAHYVVTQLDNAELREVAIFSLLWLKKGAIEGPDGLLEVGSHGAIQEAIARLTRLAGRDSWLVPLVVGAPWDMEGIDAVLSVLKKLQERCEDGIITIKETIIETALSRILNATRTVCLDHLPHGCTESDIVKALHEAGCTGADVRLRRLGQEPLDYAYARLKSCADAKSLLSKAILEVRGKSVQVERLEPETTLEVQGGNWKNSNRIASWADDFGGVVVDQRRTMDGKFNARLRFARGNDARHAQSRLSTQGARVSPSRTGTGS